ncbi:MAG: hypothetical protein GQ529_06920, partial [Methyloprofundus sp.]|nr:hypothetical protein [Methyloprofundus sp.]
YAEYGANWSDDENCENYGVLSEHEESIRKHIKSHFSELKEKQIKDLLDNKNWIIQKQNLLKAKQLQQSIGTAQHDGRGNKLTYSTGRFLFQ